MKLTNFTLFKLSVRLSHHLLYQSAKMASMIIFLAASIFIQGTLGELVCENLGAEVCAFAVASSGTRCSLETYPSEHGRTGLQCRDSDIMAGISLSEHIENDNCISSCGVERESVGISSDKLLETEFTMKLCSEDCQFNCHNIVDLYSSLALAEGLYLPAMCRGLAGRSSRKLTQIRSSGAVAQESAEPPIP